MKFQKNTKDFLFNNFFFQILWVRIESSSFIEWNKKHILILVAYVDTGRKWTKVKKFDRNLSDFRYNDESKIQWSEKRLFTSR